MSTVHRLVVAAVAAGAVTLSAIAAAHHSFASYDESTRVTVTGVLKEFRWQNPHLELELLVEQPNGEAQLMHFGGPAINDWRTGGWVKSDFVLGDKLTITGFPKRDDKNSMSINILVNGKGKSYGKEIK